MMARRAEWEYDDAEWEFDDAEWEMQKAKCATAIGGRARLP